MDSNVQPGVGKFGCNWLKWFAVGREFDGKFLKLKMSNPHPMFYVPKFYLWFFVKKKWTVIFSWGPWAWFSLQTQYTVGQYNHLTICNSLFLPQWKVTEIFNFTIFRDDGTRLSSYPSEKSRSFSPSSSDGYRIRWHRITSWCSEPLMACVTQKLATFLVVAFSWNPQAALTIHGRNKAWFSKDWLRPT